METKHWRQWLGEKPAFYMNSIDRAMPAPEGVNLLGFAHDALDEIDRLNALLEEARGWWRHKAGDAVIVELYNVSGFEVRAWMSKVDSEPNAEVTGLGRNRSNDD
jgi:hypothetical protein